MNFVSSKDCKSTETQDIGRDQNDEFQLPQHSDFINMKPKSRAQGHPGHGQELRLDSGLRPPIQHTQARV